RAARLRHHRAELRVHEPTRHREETSYDPRREDPRDRREALRDRAGRQKDAAAHDRADHEERRVVAVQAADERALGRRGGDVLAQEAGIIASASMARRRRLAFLLGALLLASGPAAAVVDQVAL